MFRVLIKVFIYKICVLVLFIDYCFGINNVVISNVPNKNIYFIGRDNELNKIKTSFKEQNILAIVGSAGIGKTQIAKQYANNSAEYDLIWWIESGKSIVAQYLKLVDDLNGKQLLAEKLYVPINSEAKAIKKVRDILENLCMNMLFIFDDFDNYAEIKDLIPTSTACPQKKLSVLVTSKNLLSWNNSIRIEEFHRDESINLFRQFIGNRDTQSMKKLSEALGDYPIAITQSAVYLKTNPNVSIEQYIELFNNRRVALWGYEEKLVTQQHADLDNYKKTVFTAVGINVKELKQKSENAFKLALLISFMHSSDIPEKILKKNFKDILEMNEAIFIIQSNALLVLNGKRHTEVDLDNFYSIHEVQQAVIRDLATDNEKKESIKKLAENLNALLPKQIDLFVPMLIEKPYLIQHLEKVCKHAKKLNILDDNILNLHIRRLEYVLSFKKDFNAAAEIIQNIEGLLMQAPKSSISSLTKTRFKLMELTYLSWQKGAYQTSIEMANNVLEDLVKLSDVDEEYLMTYNKLAQSYLYIGDVENSLKYSDLGQKVVDHTVGYLGNKDAFYSIRARILLDLGKFEEALDNIKLSSVHAQKWERPMTILATQALILFKMEKYQESYDAVNESFKAACSMFGDEDSPLAAFQLTIIAASSLKIGNIEEANCNIERAMKILQETYKDNIHRSHAFAYIVYGDIKVAQGLYDEAQNAYLLADSMYCKVMLNKKIDDVSYLYMQLAINSARLSDKLKAFFYLDEHRDLFGEAHKRTLAIIKYLYDNGLIDQ